MIEGPGGRENFEAEENAQFEQGQEMGEANSWSGRLLTPFFYLIFGLGLLVALAFILGWLALPPLTIA